MDLKTAESLTNIFYYTPCNIFFKNMDNKYIMCNNTFALALGLNRPEDIMGRSDAELAWYANAKIYINNDLFVAKSKTPYHFEEDVILQSQIITYHSYKIPLINKDNKVIATMGICSLNHNLFQNQVNSVPTSSECLTTKEIQIANLIAQGKRNKDIATRLNISERTVEWHRNNIYSKLHITPVVECVSVIAGHIHSTLKK